MAVPVLMYHALDDHPAPISITPTTFSRQMRWLYENQWQTVTFGELTQAVLHQRQLPPRTICLTFDDGFAGVYDHAFPLLQEYGFSATVFLVAGHIGQDNSWPGQPESIPILPLLTWAQIEEMAHYYVEFGAHTLTHPRLDQLPAAQLQGEIFTAQAMLAERLGQAVNVFAYPYGRFNDHVRTMVAETYLGACTTQPGRVSLNLDPWTLPRADAFYLQSPFLFQQLATPRLFHYLQLRGIISRAVSVALRRPW